MENNTDRTATWIAILLAIAEENAALRNKLADAKAIIEQHDMIQFTNFHEAIKRDNERLRAELFGQDTPEHTMALTFATTATQDTRGTRGKAHARESAGNGSGITPVLVFATH